MRYSAFDVTIVETSAISQMNHAKWLQAKV